MSFLRDSTGRALRALIAITALAILGFHFYALVIQPLDPLIFRVWHIAGLVVFGALVSLTVDSRWLRYTAPALALAVLVGAIYMTMDISGITMRAGVLPSDMDVIIAVMMVAAVLEVTRRTTGNAIFILAILAILYGLYGNHLPDFVGHRGYSFERLITYLYTTNGLLNIPLGSSATYIYLFVLFGSLMMASGAGEYLIKLAIAMSGRARGGPAKVAITASGFFGMINGTSAGNVVATGSMTIPMMKRAGYTPTVSASVEATSSSGGQILPPVMGAAAFLMVDMTGMSYTSIITAATIPAVLYFLSVVMMSHYEAVNRGIGGVSDEELKMDRKSLLTGLYFLLPPLVLIFCLLVLNVSIILSGLYAIAATLLVSWIRTPTRIGPKVGTKASIDAASSILPIAATCATAGIIMGVLNLTGMGLKMAMVIITITDGSLFLTLLLAMVVTIVLGMGLPTVAAYAITGAVVAPALTRLGVEPMAAHLFVLYFAAMSAITPPVSLASFAAAAVARAPVWPVAMTALKLGTAGFIVPYLFVYRPEILMAGSLGSIVFQTAIAMIAIISLAAALQLRTDNWWPRVAWFVGAILLLTPDLLLTFVGLATAGLATAWELRHRRQQRVVGYAARG
ncbi:TRAP transporter fused permease subunit [Halomonas daqingensis]|uniref:TRAP transporter fused permease subunit n=1 Tax=Billgrantia desiderata TaxID=52021 RepID=A0ABS9B5L0_9GAMM|nr:TRAP transporter fused permease subunit [Halomonas desiderata]MCE8042361.1 TRAP transporter fused permease subunit [Halomonas desiderata]MCE8046936.1 TRAP transporter fused permease subunit [Halomonas desiderata]